MKFKKILLPLFVILLASFASAALTGDIHAAYQMNEGTGSTTIDGTGNNPVSNQSSIVWVNGSKYLNGSRYDGSAGRTFVPKSAITTGSSGTISFWVIANISGTNEEYISYANGSTFAFRIGQQLADRQIYYGFYENTYNQVPLAYKLSGTLWQLVTVTTNTTNHTLYVNDSVAFQGTRTTPNGFGSAADFTLGWSNANGFWRGEIDEVIIWNKTLSAADVTELYNAGIGKFYPFASGLFEITGRDNRTGATITTFNATVNGSFYSTTNGTIVTNLTLSPSFIVNITVQSATYFPVTYTNYNTTVTLQANLTQWTAIYARARDNNGQILNFTLNITNSSGTFNQSTTTGVVYLPIYNSSWNVSIFNAHNLSLNYSRDNATLNASLYLSNYTFMLYTSNSFNITFRDEKLNNILYTYGSDTNIRVEFIGDLGTYNYTANGTLYVELLTPQTYTIRYQKANFGRIREYILTLTNQTFNQLTLYLLNQSVSNDFTVVVFDSTTLDLVENATVYLQRYNLSANSYLTVAMYSTDVSGSAYFDAEYQNETYRVQVDYPWGTTRFVSNPFYVETTPVNVYINLADVFGTSWFESEGITHTNITYSNGTGTPTLSVTYNDPSASASSYCLQLSKETINGKTVINTSCSTSNTGTLSVTGLQNVLNLALFTASIGGKNVTMTGGFKDFTTSNMGAGAYGVYLAMGLFMVFALFTFYHTFALILAGFSLVLSKILGILPLDWGVIGGVITVCVIVMLFLDKR